MSQEGGDASVDPSAALDWFKQWFHVPAVVVLLVFMFWVRARTWGNYVVDGTIVFRGNDAWYHLRQVQYVVRHWPETMPYEVWTHYPHGTTVAQFGTIYDQVIATVALIVGLGSPSTHTVKMVHLFTPAVLGALILLPTYYLGKRLGKSRFAGVVAGLVVALATGSMLGRSMVGFSDHQVAEAFTQALAVLAIVVAIQVGDAEKPVWELLVERDVQALRRPIGYGTLGGIGLALYIWVWPPGVLLIGILGLYITIQAIVHFLRGRSPEHVSIVTAVVFLVAAILLFLPLDQLAIKPIKFSLMQPGLAFAGAVWCGVLSWMGRYWDEQSYPSWTYPTAVVGILAVGIAVIALVSPNLFGLLENQLLRVFGRVFGHQPSAAASTVGEVQPLSNVRGTLRSWYGFTHILAALGVFVAIAQLLVTDEDRSELVFVSLWLVVIFAASYTQARFSYYLTVPVAVMTAYVVGVAMQYVARFGERASDTDVRPYQVMAILTILLLIVAPMTLVSAQGQRQDVLTQSNSGHNPQPSGFLGWQSSLNWMAKNTPAEGNFAGAGNHLKYWGQYGKTNDFNYPNGTYGVVSWWDYGHWITVAGKRIPVANPFQESASEAAKFLIARNETRANQVIQQNMSEGPNQETRYVMVDWKMATANPQFGAKFFAPPAWVKGVSQSTFYNAVRPIIQRQGGASLSSVYLTVQKQAYYETMVNRLYRYHGSAAWPGYVSTGMLPQTPPWQSNLSGSLVPVTRTQTISTRSGRTFLTTPQNGPMIRVFRSTAAARSYAKQNSTSRINAQVGGIGKFPSEYVPALQHYRLVQNSNATANPYSASQPGLSYLSSRGLLNTSLPSQYFGERYSAWTKVFERVPGATVQGTVQGASNETVYANVNLHIPSTNSSFNYVQRAETGPDGSFTMTLPYSTTGYDNWGPNDGHTNVSVRATSDYTFTTAIKRVNQTTGSRYNGTASVSEAKVIGEDTSPVEVSLTQSTISFNQNSTSGNNTGGTNGTSGNTTGGTDGGTNSTDGTNQTDSNQTQSIAHPSNVVDTAAVPRIRVAG